MSHGVYRLKRASYALPGCCESGFKAKGAKILTRGFVQIKSCPAFTYPKYVRDFRRRDVALAVPDQGERAGDKLL